MSHDRRLSRAAIPHRLNQTLLSRILRPCFHRRILHILCRLEILIAFDQASRIVLLDLPFFGLCNMMHIQMLSEAALPPCPLTGRTYTARAAICGYYFRLIIAFLTIFCML